LKLEAHGISHPGAVRTSNQDRLLIDPDLGLFLICDGMGGHQHGEVAAEIAVAAVRHYVESSRNPAEVTWPFGYNMNLSVESNRLLTAIRLANRQVWRKAEEELESAGMGTTVAAILAGPTAATVANVGDSRIFRCKAGKLEQISIDDTMVNVMLSKGVITPDAIASHPMRHMLTQAAGSQESVEVHLREMTFEPGETWLICSDGLSGVVDEGSITGVLGSSASLKDCTQQLLDAALGRGAPDNVSILLLRPA
jgi:serine/threonine protein phosphatase PrpC